MHFDNSKILGKYLVSELYFSLPRLVSVIRYGSVVLDSLSCLMYVHVELKLIEHNDLDDKIR